MSHQHPTRLLRAASLITLPIALTAFTPAAHALQMDAGANWSYNGAAAGTDSDGPASSGFVDILGWDSDTSNNANSIFYHTYGDSAGNFGSRVSGTGDFSITGQYSFSESYVASMVNPVFSFNIVPGELAFYNLPALSGSDQLSASYLLDIRLNGVSIWDSYALLLINSSGQSLTQTGTTLTNAALTGNQYAWDSHSQSLTLNGINIGDTFTLDYDLTTIASSNIVCMGNTTTEPPKDPGVPHDPAGANGATGGTMAPAPIRPPALAPLPVSVTRSTSRGMTTLSPSRAPTPYPNPAPSPCSPWAWQASGLAGTAGAEDERDLKKTNGAKGAVLLWCRNGTIPAKEPLRGHAVAALDRQIDQINH